MVFPIGDTNIKGGAYPMFSYGFIALNVMIFIFQSSLTNQDLNQFIYTYGAIPQEITSGQDYYTLVSSMFLHSSWMHLIGNMMFLWVFADNIEQTIGNRLFLLFYLIGGFAAVFGHIYFNWDSPIPMVGASGAIAAVMGAYLVMFPRSKVKVLFMIFPFSVPAFLFLGIWIFQQMSNGIGTLSDQTASGVAWWAHIGGFIFGLLAGLFFRSTGKLKYELEEYKT